MPNAKQFGFMKSMNLSSEEISTFEKYVNLIERAEKNSVDFFKDKDTLAFTPAALLVVAVAKFAYDVYQDYGRIAADPADFQVHFKRVIKQLHQFESASDNAPSLDSYAIMRQELLVAKKEAKK